VPKKSAIAVALSVVGIVVTASLAVALNVGILSETAPDDSVAGDEETSAISPDDPGAWDEPQVITVFVDEPMSASPASGTGALPAAPRAAAVNPGAAPTTSVLPTASPAPAVTYPIYDVGEAGQVALEFSDGKISFWGAYPTDGWEYAVDDDGPGEVEVSFRSGDVEIEFKAVLRDGEIQVRIETEIEERHGDDDDGDEDDDGDHDEDDDRDHDEDEDEDDHDEDKDHDEDDDDEDDDDD
jgi:hypothetical protein